MVSFCVLFYVLFFGTTSFATDNTTTLTITEVFPDGSYIESFIEEDLTIVPFSVSTKSGKKTDTFKSKSGDVLWSVTVHGTFSYDGSTARCTSSSLTTTCPNSNWKLSNKSASKSGATAKASVTAKRYIGNSLVQTLDRTVTLTCSKSGKLS